ncbi:aminomethyltransferase beta-barrel domain-containing protein, partial [Chloroflexota bacterium]
PQLAITPGQAIVFYDGNAVIGGGTIELARKQDIAKIVAVHKKPRKEKELA